MKKVLSIIMVTSLLTGCSPSRSEMKSSIDDLTTKLSQSEKTIEEKEKEQKKQVELLCALTAEIANYGVIAYVGGNTFMLPDGSLQTIDSMSDECLEMLREYERTVRERAEILAKKPSE